MRPSMPTRGLPGTRTRIYLQGSYRNYTNIRGDSDVDIVAELRSSFSPDLSILSQPEQAAFNAYYADQAQA